MHVHAGTRVQEATSLTGLVPERVQLTVHTTEPTGTVPEPFRNRSTAITSRGGRLVPERVDAVEQVWTRATGTVPEPFWFQTCGVNTALGCVADRITNITQKCMH